MHLNIHALIIKYGYLALFIGCVAEGETFILLGGISVHEGLLQFNNVILTAITGSIVGDQVLYWIGKKYGIYILYYFRSHKKKINRAKKLIKNYPSFFIIAIRFIYGFRLIGPIIIGTSKLKAIKFFILNVTGSVIWAITFVTLGYYFGNFLLPYLYKLSNNIEYLLLILITIVVLIPLIKLIICYFKSKNLDKL